MPDTFVPKNWRDNDPSTPWSAAAAIDLEQRVHDGAKTDALNQASTLYVQKQYAKGVYLMDYPGAHWDGINPDDAAFAAAIADAQTKSCYVILPRDNGGHGVLTGPLPVLGNCRGIIGAGRGETNIRIQASSVNNVWGGSSTGFWGAIPPAPTLSLLNSAGNLGVGTYRYKIVFLNSINWSGPTVSEVSHASAEATITTTSGSQQVQLTLPTGPAGKTTARQIYRTAVNGASGSEVFLGTVNDNTTTIYVDNVADGSLFTQFPVPVISSFQKPTVLNMCGYGPWNNYTYQPHYLEGFSIWGDTDPFGPGKQASMWQIDGILLGSVDEARDVQVQGLYAGFTIQGDHNNLYNCWGQVNAIGLRHTAPNYADLGNNTFIACKFDHPCLSSVSVKAGSTTQGDLYSQTHMGWGPYCFYKEGLGSTHVNQPVGEQFIDSCLIEMCFFEAIGNGVAYDSTSGAIISNNVWLACQGGSFPTIETDVRVGNQYSISTAPADWAVYAGGIIENRFYGGTNFGPGNKGVFCGNAYFFDFYQDMAQWTIDTINTVNTNLNKTPGTSQPVVFCGGNTWGSLHSLKCKYHDTECVILPCNTYAKAGDVVFTSGVNASQGCSRSNNGIQDQPIAGVALCSSSTNSAQSAIPVAVDGVVNVNLTAGLNLNNSAGPGGWIKPTPFAADGTATVAQNKADYSIGYWIGGQTGQTAPVQVQISGGGALINPPPIVNFGSGGDGAVVMDGVNTFSFATYASPYYTLTRDVFATDFTLNSGIEIKTGGFRIFCSGSFTNNGQLNNAGGPGGTSTGGGGGFQGDYGGGAAGGTPNAAGINATNALGGAGGASSVAAGGTVTIPSASNGGANPTPAQMINPPVSYFGGAGGAGGASGGGGGGGIIAIFSKNIAKLGAFDAVGGNGSGGGGGGGGGYVYIAYQTTASALSIPQAAISGGLGGGSGGVNGANGNAFFVQCVSLNDTGAMPDLQVTPTVTTNSVAIANRHNPYDATSGNLTTTLPVASLPGQLLSIEKLDSTTHTVSITGNVRGLGGTTQALALQHETEMFVSDSSGNWWIIAGRKGLSQLDLRYNKGFWKPYIFASSNGVSGLVGGNIYLYDPYFPGLITSGTANSGICAFYLDPIAMSGSGSLLLRLRGTIVTNAVAPACNFKFQLSPISSFTGASGANPAANVGSAVLEADINAPAASSANHAESGSYTLTTAGWYAIVFVPSANQAAGSNLQANVDLEWST